MKSTFVRTARLLLATAALSLLVPSAASAGAAFSKIVVFGDSLNDHGNMTQFTGGAFPNDPPYVFGRQSNGRVWVEYLACRLGLADQLVNYAVVGALTKPTNEFPTGNVWSNDIPGLEGTDVTTQVQDYLADSNGAADPAALHIVEGGANDFAIVQDPTTIVQNLVACVMTLQQAGAKHIVVLNLPDFGKTPRAILAERYGIIPEGSTQRFSIGSAQLNAALDWAIASVTPRQVKTTIVDLHGFMNAVSQNPAAYGIVEVVLPYLMAGAGADPTTWLFWDDLHPTTRGHQMLADHALSTLVERYSMQDDNADQSGIANAIRRLVPPPVTLEP